MNIREFVRETLVQIVGGVQDAHADVAALGGEVCLNGATLLAGKDEYPMTMAHNGGRSIVETVVFDLAVTVMAESSKSGSGGVKLYVATLGGESSRTSQSSTVNRVQFSVPLALPNRSRPR